MKIEAGKFYRDTEGNKIGPMKGSRFLWEQGKGGLEDPEWDKDGTGTLGSPPDLVAEWTDEPTGPVRTVTRKEIVLGAYGIVKVQASCRTGVCVELLAPTVWRDAGQLRAAAATLIEIADALEDGK